MPPVSSTEDVNALPVDPVAQQDLSTDASADSSTASDQGAKQPETMLDAVVAAVQGGSKAAESPNPEGSTGTDASPNDPDASVKAEDEGRKDEEDLKLPFHKHPRWQEMKEANRALRADSKAKDEQIAALTAEHTVFKQSHDQFQGLVSFMQQSSLTSDEVNTGLEIMRMMKHDPERALQALMPYVDTLRTAAGYVLPPELKQQVDQGMITEDAAVELSRTRSREALARHAADNALAQVEQIQASRQVETVVSIVQNAVSAWERAWSTSPDYKTLQPHVNERIELELNRRRLAGTLPRTADEAVQIAEFCRTEVSNKLRAFLPQKREIRPIASGGTVQATAKPATMLGAIEQALQAG